MSQPIHSVTDLRPDLFQGKTALVTGGGTGLGLEISRGLASLGARVIIASRSEEHHAPLLAEAAERGWQVEAEVLDVRSMGAVAEVAERVHGRLAQDGGSGALDILVNNAAGNFVCPAERLTERAWRAVLGIVLDGTFYCSREFGKGMIRAERGGSILNIVATYAWTGMPGVVHSASAKAGVLAMTKTLAAEWARHRIRVNAIAPGVFESEGAGGQLWPNDELKQRLTDAVPAKRFATSAEIAQHCLWLLAPASDYVTGECFTVDGGASLGRGMWEPGERVERR